MNLTLLVQERRTLIFDWFCKLKFDNISEFQNVISDRFHSECDNDALRTKIDMRLTPYYQ